MAKPVPSGYIPLALAGNQFIIGHLYTFTAISGDVDYFTDLDLAVDVGGIIYKANSLRIEGMRRKIAVGLEVDEQEITIWAQPTDTLFGSIFLSSVEEGILDGCIIQRQRAVWPLVTGNLQTDIAAAPAAVWTMFTGYTSEITKGGMTHVEMKVKSPLVKLEINMPRNYYQPGCLHTLYDSGCTLIQSSFAYGGVIDVGATSTVIPIVGGIPGVGLDGIQYFAVGKLYFTSGVNNGLVTLMDTNTTSALILSYPLSDLPSPGDTVVAYPGCSKGFPTCQLKFGNQANFRGFDKVPPVMLSL